ncbi:glycoside hydrolase family 25 protein [Streptomyces sp. NPDC085946]|uniref:glycoside hydrolase family 25 protein n=1 Tax=Streptomyces sp. NPDC085946 TaxID=3365744 RepID=UPI0037D4EBA9
MLRGIDVSSYQPASYDTDGLSFVFVKATEGRSYVNPRLAAQTRTARDAGLVVGFYHFLWPGNLTAQAEYFVAKAPERPGDILAVDWETTGDGTHASNAEKDRFIRKVKELRPGHRVVLYCNRHFWLDVDTTSYAGDGLWIADYVAAGKPRIEAAWRFHQYTDDPVDTNVAAFASRAALQTWAGGA